MANTLIISNFTDNFHVIRNVKMSDIISQMGGLAEAFLSKHTTKIRKSFKTLFIETLILYVVMQKTNFTQLAAFGNHNEKTYRSHFEKGGVDMVAFNFELAKDYFEGSIGIRALAVDPSYINKSGKHTLGLGYFWSGCAGQAKWGLEILGVGIIDTFRHECVMLGGFQSPNSSMLSTDAVIKGGEPTRYLVGSEAVTDMEHVRTVAGDVVVKRPYHKSSVKAKIDKENPEETERRFNLIDWYLHTLGCLPKDVFEYTKRVVADAFFSKKPFVDGLTKLGLKIISRFRDDAILYYIYKGPKTGKPGAPKKYDGKVDVKNLDMKVFHEIDYSFEGGRCYAGIVYSKSLGQAVKAVVWISKDGSKHKIFFSNDLTLSGRGIVETYRCRFLVEFEFRNAKGFASLEKCQARSTKKYRTHFNMSFTSLNCLKVAARDCGIPYSISNLKTLVHGQYLMNRFIDVSGIHADTDLITKLNNEVFSLTTMQLDVAA